MAATIVPARWLRFLDDEYLARFIREGGSSIKFAVPLDERLRPELGQGLLSTARAAGYLTATVSSAETRVHMIDQLFNRIAEQIPWRELSARVMLKLADEHGFVAPGPGPEPLVRRLADANALDAGMVTMEGRRWVAKQVLHRPSLAKEFRTAMTTLCMAELLGGSDGDSSVAAITDWLTGRNKATAAVKPYQIYSRITRSNARHLLDSLLLWIQYAGHPGLVVTVDLSRMAVARNPRDGQLFYSKAQLLDAYEVLRQFIDSTDRMKGCLMVMLPAADFLDVEPFGRGMGAYSALKFRVYDEVHDQRLVNPMSSLVRISPLEHVA